MSDEKLNVQEVDAVLRCIDHFLSTCVASGAMSIEEANNTVERSAFNKLMPVASDETKRNFGF